MANEPQIHSLTTTAPLFQVIGPFQYGQFQTFTNVNDHYSNICEPWQPTPLLPLLEEAELLTSSTGLGQSGNTTCVVGNALPQLGNSIFELGNAIPQSENAIYGVGNALPQAGKNIYGVGNALLQSGNNIYGVGNAVLQPGNTIYGVGNAVPQFENTTYGVGNAVPHSGSTTYGVGNAVPLTGSTTYGVGNAVPQSGNTTYDVGNAVPQSGNTTYDVGNAVPQPGNTIYGMGNAVPQSHMPFLSQSTFVGLPTDATDEEVSIAPPHPTSVNEILPHDSTSPLGLHGPIQHTEPNTCQECTQSFPSTAELERHAKRLYHDAFKCKCGNHYARLDNLKRHWDQSPKFPCPHCTKYTGVKAFPREDHLTQHLQTYHRHSSTSILGGNQRDPIAPITTDTAASPTNITTTSTMPLVCTVSECTHYQQSFKIKSQYTDHMRCIHNHSPFPCLVQGCNRIGGKGYFRERDLFKHSQQVHYSVDN